MAQLFEDIRGVVREVDETAMSEDGLGKGRGREIVDIPMCSNCHVRCENDDEDTLQSKALARVDRADGGLSRNRWKATGQIKRAPVVRGPRAQNQQLGGGDGSRDVPPSLLPVAVAPTSASRAAGETIAKLHYRRSRDPRYAELECLVPLDSAIYVSILDPLDTPTFKPSPTKPIPAWMQWLPDQRGRNRVREARPYSMLDVHFPPPSRFARRTPPAPPPQTRGQQQTEMACPTGRPKTHIQKELASTRESQGRPLIPLNTRSPAAASSPPPQPPLQRNLQRPKPRQYRSSDYVDNIFNVVGDAGSDDGTNRSYSPDSHYATSGTPSPYKRPSAVTDEPLRRPSSRLVMSQKHAGKNLYRQPEVEEDEHGICPPISEGKGKSVAWHRTVVGGSNDVASGIRYEPPLTVRVRENSPKRRDSPLADESVGAWHRISKPRTPPAQSREFIDLYKSDKAARTTQASFAMPGRGRGREIGRGCKKEK